MSEFDFIYEHAFIAELNSIEPDQCKQMYLMMRIEDACTKRVQAGMRGYGFVRLIVEMTPEQAARWNAGDMEDGEMDALEAALSDDSTYGSIGSLLQTGAISEDDLHGEPANDMGEVR